MKVAVLGASGTVGRALVPLLAKQHDVLAVSRQAREATSGIRWTTADATDGTAVQRAFESVEVAYYLVHSLGGRDFE